MFLATAEDASLGVLIGIESRPSADVGLRLGSGNGRGSGTRVTRRTLRRGRRRRRSRRTLLVLDSSREDSSEVRHGLHEFGQLGVLGWLGFRGASEETVGVTRTEHERRSLVNIGEDVFVGSDCVFHDSEALEDLVSDVDRETTKIGFVPIKLGDSLVRDEVGRVGEESTIVLSEFVASHVALARGATDESLEIVLSVASIAVEMGVAAANLGLKIVPGGIRVRSRQTGDILPRVAIGTCVADRPSDLVCFCELCAPA
jgi:hypothetical protein